MLNWLKNEWQNLSIFIIIKLLGNILAVSAIRNLFFGAKQMNKRQRRIFLYMIVISILLNIFGTYRNSFTLWKYKDFMSFFWLGQDIAQLLYSAVLYTIVKMEDRLWDKGLKLFLYVSILFVILNFYSFIINFHYFNFEGPFIFLFWFINNFYIGAFSSTVTYIILFKKGILNGRPEAKKN